MVPYSAPIGVARQYDRQGNRPVRAVSPLACVRMGQWKYVSSGRRRARPMGAQVEGGRPAWDGNGAGGLVQPQTDGRPSGPLGPPAEGGTGRWTGAVAIRDGRGGRGRPMGCPG
ncbi:hypothetical protein chiPu_0022422, partial [Chiloscyllium punctatum]|nr:hypothetical protein [Chiloscyllium punctatum]